jgi:twitching motility protein PilT
VGKQADASLSVLPPVAMGTAEAPASPPAQPRGPRKQIDPLVQALFDNKGSDLHISAGLQPRMRKDGDIVLVPGFNEVLSSDAIRAMLMEIAPQNSKEKFEKTNDADYAYELPGIARFRVNAFKDRRGVGGVLRVIPSKILTYEQLNLPPVCKELCQLHKGLVVVTGPTGSGKSTTLAAMVDWINKNRNDHIITIEDPVEFVHDTKGCLVNQREIHADTQSFSAALRAALREDPDICLVGEMRDLETVSIAIETAETGHLVFGTLHTNTAVGTIDRIIDQFPTDRQTQVRMMLSESLKGVIAQSLCKKIGGGRVAALEILVVNHAVSNLIREGKTFQIPSLMQTQKSLGMQTLNEALFNLVKDGLVTPDDAWSKSVDRAGFKNLLDKAQIKLGETH